MTNLSITWLPFETEALATAEFLEPAGAQVRVARAEDLVIYKAIAFRPDQRDIERLATLQETRPISIGYTASFDEPERSC